MIRTSLFYYYENVFIFTNMWMIVKDSMKRHYLKRKFLYSLKYGRLLQMQIIPTQKEFVKI